MTDLKIYLYMREQMELSGGVCTEFWNRIDAYEASGISKFGVVDINLDPNSSVDGSDVLGSIVRALDMKGISSGSIYHQDLWALPSDVIGLEGVTVHDGSVYFRSDFTLGSYGKIGLTLSNLMSHISFGWVFDSEDRDDDLGSSVKSRFSFITAYDRTAIILLS